jgi:phenylacetate-coenzyme A ligase PaaK-like adenylate-forming protein
MHDPRAEAMSTDERAALQQQRLRSLVDRLLGVGGLMADRLSTAGVRRGADLTLADLASLPTTDKQDLWDAYPFGLLCVPRRQVASVHGSSGTGGRPTLVAYTEADLALWGEMTARSLACAGAGAGSLIHNAYGYGLFNGGLGIHYGARAIGATVVPVSGGMTARQVTLVRDLAPDVLTCTPSYAVTLGTALREAGVTPTMRAGLFGAEPWSGSLRAQLEHLLGLKALDIYGLSEVIGPGVATECLPEQAGLHVNEDHFLVEVLDPVSGQPVPDGVPGELAFTTPTKEALPLLRYRTGDIASLDRTPCSCGRTLARMSKVLGRKDDMLVVRGVNVYPSEIEAVLLADPRVVPHYVLVLDERTARRELVVCCEGSVPPAELAAALHERLGLRADVRVLAPGSVPRQEVGKAVRVVRWASGPPPLPALAG